MYVDDPPYIFRPTIRFAYRTGIRRWACFMQTTIVEMVKMEGWGISAWLQLVPNRFPERASATMPVDCRMARPTVRYLVYWVIFAWPDWPSWRSVSRRGMTTARSCRMMLAVM